MLGGGHYQQRLVDYEGLAQKGGQLGRYGSGSEQRPGRDTRTGRGSKRIEFTEKLICFSVISRGLTSQMEFRSEAVQRQRRMESIQIQFNCILAIRSRSSSKPGQRSLPTHLQQRRGRLVGTEGALGTLGMNFLDPLGLSAAVFRKLPSSALCFPSLRAPNQGPKWVYIKRTSAAPMWATPPLHTSSYHPDSGKAGSRLNGRMCRGESGSVPGTSSPGPGWRGWGWCRESVITH